MKPITTTLAVVAVAITLAACSTSDASVEDLAKGACHDAVKTMLKSPGSASFGTDVVSGDRDTGLKVVGTVDSENSFGASLRSAYQCSVTWDESTKTASARVTNMR